MTRQSIRAWHMFVASVLLAAVAGCSDLPPLARNDVRSATIDAQSSAPEARAHWQATDAEIDALVAAINDGRPIRPNGGTTPRVFVVMTLRDGSTIKLSPTSQGVHYMTMGGETSVLKGRLLDEQFDYLEAKTGRIGDRY